LGGHLGLGGGVVELRRGIQQRCGEVSRSSVGDVAV
jgi:hypothetical protein